MSLNNNKSDFIHKDIIRNILYYGTKDKNPRPKYKDGTPAYTYSYNGRFDTYDLSNGELPIITLRPIASKSAIGEMLWIYQDQSNDLDLLKEKYGVTWWDPWDIGNRTIGQCYGATVKKYDLMNKLLYGLKNDPDSRRHIISLWQEDDFKKPHGLAPCCYLTMWNVRHTDTGDYLDMTLVQRSCDYCTAGVINQLQYCVLQTLVAKHCNLIPGKFNWVCQNIQIYDRHVDAAKELLVRIPVNCKPYIKINEDKTNFYDFTVDDIEIADYPIDTVKKLNPNISVFKNEIAI